MLRPEPVEELRQDIILREVADEGQVVVFSLDSSNYEETAEMIAGFDYSRFGSCRQSCRHRRSIPVQCIMDEFSAVDATNILVC